MNGIFLSSALTAEAPAKTFPFIIPKEDDGNKFQQRDENLAVITYTVVAAKKTFFLKLTLFLGSHSQRRRRRQQ